MFILIEYLLTQLTLTGSKSLRTAIFEVTKKFEPILITRHATTIMVITFMYQVAKFSQSVL